MARLFRKSLPVNVNDTKRCVYMRVSVYIKRRRIYIYISMFMISRKKQSGSNVKSKQKKRGGGEEKESATIKMIASQFLKH